MRATEFLHEILSPVIHQKRLNTLNDLVEGLLLNKKLSVTELGRGIQTEASERSAIRRSDRFIGNNNIHTELPAIFKTQARMLIGNQQNPIIIVDWSQIPNTGLNVLRAALACEGRSLTLYEEVHPTKLLGNREVEKHFLWNLKNQIPAECQPIITTDAGFHNEWFKCVINLGWNYVGRVRGIKVCRKENNDWMKCKELMENATRNAKNLGEMQLCKNNQITTNLVLIKEKRKRDKKYGIHQLRGGGRDRKNHRLSAMEPWLLATSLNSSRAKRIVKIYKTRMQIEEGFRDLKSARYGFGLRHAFTRTAARVTVLLLIAMLAILVAWLAGRLVEKENMHRQFQVNSTKSKRVLSWLFLGLRVIKRNIFIPKKAWYEVIATLEVA